MLRCILAFIHETEEWGLRHRRDVAVDFGGPSEALTGEGAIYSRGASLRRPGLVGLLCAAGGAIAQVTNMFTTSPTLPGHSRRARPERRDRIGRFRRGRFPLEIGAVDHCGFRARAIERTGEHCR